MPSKNKVKKYVKDGIYHAYNRGVNGEKIFLDESDYKNFIYIIQRYLSKNKAESNSSGSVKIHAYILMPNHFHMCIQQSNVDGMQKFMQSILCSYVRITNKRHSRIGHLFQDVYKARLITSDTDFIRTIQYIHNTGLEYAKKPWLYQYSDLSNIDNFTHRSKLLSYFDNDLESYRSDLSWMML